MVLCAGGMHSTLLLLLALQKWQLGFSLFVSFVQNLPQLHMLTVIFSPLEFLCILLLQEMFVQVQALQQRSLGPRSQPVLEKSFTTMVVVMMVESLSPVQFFGLHRLQHTKCLCPGYSPGKNTGVGYHFLLHLLP